MNKKSILSVSTILGLFSPVFAQAACYVNGQEVSCSQFPWWIFIVFFLVAIAFFVFWLKMLIHVIKNPVPNKVVWIICMIFFNIPTAIIYYFAVKRGFNKQISGGSPLN